MWLRDRARYWNATALEREASYPCDAHITGRHEPLVRAIDIDAPPHTVFRWLCQMRVAPYSYDWIDNLGRRSPRELTPGVERLEAGQSFMVFRLVEFEQDRHLTFVATSKARRLFGEFTATYLVRPRGGGGSRLVAKLCLARPRGLAGLRASLVAWGDLVMMRRQLLNFKELAERTG